MSLAMWLRAGRAQRKLSLEDVARITKIQPRILAQLEAGNLEGLPADVFVKGFVRSFAKCCGLDEREAIERLGAAQSGQATAVAKAFVDSMSVRLVQPTQAGEPSSLTEIPVLPEVEVEAAPVADVIETAPVAETAPVVETAPVAEVIDAAPVVETAPAIEVIEVAAVEADDSSKKKKRKKGQRSRKKKSGLAEAVVAAAAEPFMATAPATDEPVIAAAAAASADVEIVIEASATTTENTTDAAVLEPTLAEGSSRMSAPEIALAAAIASEEILSREAIDSMSTLSETDDVTTDVVGGTWQPTMPALSTVPSVPWRRPQLSAQPAYVVPTLVIDDSDPESADREREGRTSRDQSRLSFLPAILLEREDRSQRQGGLTLAVIILLIAATLTLSYLMRRPSARGEGVTLLDGQTELLG